jgi:2-oxoglutarate ferredoxin oxidoreductase subunit gamma
MKTEIVLSGVGGQGLISTGEILGQAASIYEDLNATMTAAYGSETRGTFTKTDVIISDGQIGYPNVVTPDLILCLAQVAYDKYVDKFTDKTLIFYDTDEVKPAAGAKGKHIGFPFREMSIKLGSPQVANTIALGVIIKETGLLKKESIMQAIAARFKGKDKVIALNDKALTEGMKL